MALALAVTFGPNSGGGSSMCFPGGGPTIGSAEEEAGRSAVRSPDGVALVIPEVVVADRNDAVDAIEKTVANVDGGEGLMAVVVVAL